MSYKKLIRLAASSFFLLLLPRRSNRKSRRIAQFVIFQHQPKYMKLDQVRCSELSSERCKALDRLQGRKRN